MEQSCCHISVALTHREVKRRAPSTVTGGERRGGTKQAQRLGEAFETICHRQVQWGPAKAVAYVERRPCVEKPPDRGEVIVLNRPE